MRVLFVLPNAAVGGVERVRLTLIEYLVRRGVDCRLALRCCRGELIEQARALAPVDELAPQGIHQFVPALARLINKERPTHVVTAFSDVAVLTWVAMRLAGSGARWIHSVDNTHSMAASRAGIWGRLRYRAENRMAGFAYRHANAIVAVSEGLRREIVDRYGVDPSHVSMIYNPVVPDRQLQLVRGLSEDFACLHGAHRIVAVGRLVRQKGFDVLVRAMIGVPGTWHLEIWGEGPERANIEKVIVGLGLGGRVQLRGYTPDPFAVMRGADLFVLSSRHEGLGNTLIEALACQCQVVATDCPHGPREILQEGRLGELVPVDDEIALRGAVARVIAGKWHVPAQLLLERAYDFSCSKGCGRWEKLLRGLPIESGV